MTFQRLNLPIELRPETPAEAGFVDRLTRDQLREAMGGLDAGPLLEMQLRSRAAMLEQSFPDLRRRVVWAAAAPAGSLLTGERDGALHVVEIQIAPDRRRQGLAAAVLAQVAAEAAAEARDVTAHIFITNAASLALFAGAGFTLSTEPGAAQTLARLRTDINVRSDMA